MHASFVAQTPFVASLFSALQVGSQSRSLQAEVISSPALLCGRGLGVLSSGTPLPGHLERYKGPASAQRRSAAATTKRKGMRSSAFPTGTVRLSLLGGHLSWLATTSTAMVLVWRGLFQPVEMRAREVTPSGSWSLHLHGCLYDFLPSAQRKELIHICPGFGLYCIAMQAPLTREAASAGGPRQGEVICDAAQPNSKSRIRPGLFSLEQTRQ